MLYFIFEEVNLPKIHIASLLPNHIILLRLFGSTHMLIYIVGERFMPPHYSTLDT